MRFVDLIAIHHVESINIDVFVRLKFISTINTCQCTLNKLISRFIFSCIFHLFLSVCRASLNRFLFFYFVTVTNSSIFLQSHRTEVLTSISLIYPTRTQCQLIDFKLYKLNMTSKKSAQNFFTARHPTVNCDHFFYILIHRTDVDKTFCINI